MADASPYESFEDDTSGPYESLEDDHPHAAKLTPPGNFRQEGAYQGWLEMHALPQQPGRVTRDLEFPGTGYEKGQDADHTLSLGPDYNAVTHDLRGMWNKYATRDPVSGQMDLEPTAAQIDEFALPGMRGFTADSKFAKGVPADQLGSWNDDHTEYHPPGWQPESATSRIMQKASEAAGRTYDQVSAGLARGKQRNLADESMADQSLADQTLGDPLKIGAQNARQNLAVVGGQTGLLDPDTVADQIASAEKAKPPLPAFRRAADEQREKAGSFMGVLDSYIENPRATLATVMQGLSEGGVSLGLATGGGAAAGAVGGPLGAALGTAAGAGTGGYLDAYGSTILQTIKASGVDLADKDAVATALKDPALMAKAAAAGEKAGIPAAIINAVSFGVAGKLYAPAKALAGGGRLGTAAGIGAETAAQAGIGAGGEATREAVQDDKMDIGRITEAGLSQVAPTLAFTALHARGGKPAAAQASDKAAPEEPAGGFNVDDLKPQTGGPALTGSTASASDTYYPGYRWDPDAPNPQPGQPNRKGKYVPTGETAEAEAEPAAAAGENAPQENNDLGETKGLPAAARGEETPPMPAEPPVIDADFRDLPPKAKAITLQATNPDAVTVEHTDSGSVVKVNNVAISTQDTPEAAEQVAEGAREAIVERRHDLAQRKRVSEMSPEELRQTLLTHELTGMPNLRAFHEADKKPAVASIDVDGLGWVNKFGHEAGDAYLKTFAKALHEAGGEDSFHKSGDEFILQGESPEDVEQKIQQVRDRLADSTLTFTHPDGRVLKLKGVEFSHATGDTYEEADAKLDGVKAERQALGLRGPKGEAPRGASVESGQTGVQADQSGTAAEENPAETREVLGQPVEPAAEPTPAQAEAGNYRKPTVEWNGLPIKVETHAGGVRRGIGEDGQPFERPMTADYGYFPGTKANDGDGVDVLMGTHENNGTAFVIDQKRKDGTFDEHKVVLGVDSPEAAKSLYHEQYPDDWHGFQGVTQMSAAAFKDWLHNDDHTQRLSEPAAETKHPDLSEPESQFVETVGDRAAGRRNQEPVKDLREARSMYEQITGTKLTPASLKRVDELVERAIVETARSIVEEGDEPGVTYDRLVKLYERQPSLNTRTSTSIENQAYSTPAPLAYLASDLGGITHHTTVLEPTAGNGMLLIAADPAMATVNELNPERAASLEGQGFEVTRKNAVESVLGHDIDVLITNPPFGVVRDANGDSVSYQLTTPKGEPVKTNEIDHAIVLKQLEAMKGDGRAVLLIGGVNKLANTPEKRSDAYNGAAKRKFFYHLYQNYNVVDHFTVSGDMYSRQGAAWPIDMIVIHGVGKSALPLPAAAPPRVYASYPDLKGLLGKTYESNRLDTGFETAGGADRGGRGVPEPNPDEAHLPASSRGENPEHGEPVARPPGGGEGTGAGDVGGRAPAGHGELPAERGGNTPDHEQLGSRGEAHEPGRVPEIDESETPTSRELDGAPSPEGGSGRPDGAPEVVGESDGSGGVGAQEPYRAASKQNALGTLVPGNMRDSIRKSLDKLERDDGSADAFVAKEMGWPRADVGAKLAAEQVDALALAIKQIKAGKGFIIGDQTGIGKGRVVASVIQWAINHGHTPIFMTEKPKLYGDMVRDLRDIGSKDIRPLMTNAGEKVPLSETDPGDVLKSPESGRHNRVLQDAVNTASLADHNMVFTTYDQMNMQGGKQALRHQLVSTLTPNAILILDESHNAGGTTAGRSNKKKGDEAGEKTGRAAFIRGLVGRSKGVFYSSATYAKRPDVMDLYFKTDMALAVSGDVSKLPGAIQAGGVPLQQVVASMLAESGQYIRRERSFNGVRYETPVSAVDRNAAEAISSMMLKVKEFDDLKQEAVKEAKKQAKRDAKQVSEHGATGEAGAQSTNFTSLMHNLISQMLLALKADAAADHAIEALKRGEKPVITVSNTMGSFIGEYAEQAGLKTGDAIKLGFKDLMNRYLESSRRLIVKDHDGKTVSDRRMSDEELGPSAVAAFNRAKKLIDGTREIQELPVSPIDWIHKRLREEGYKTGEITGRDDTIEYRKDGSAIYKLRGDKDKSTAAKTRDLGKFNNGGIDAMILNRSGSTGLSMHASERFKDQRPRHMIIAQAEGNIDTHMQMLGRIFRTGQVELPIYSQLVADIPAEKRPAAILAKKMASLNANTTGARGSALTAKDSVDFLNDYGDEVVAQLMDDLPEIHEKLGEPLESSSTGGYDTDEAARKVTGRIPMLPVAEQEELYHLIESGYRERLAQADAMGENALEAKTLALDAKLVKKLTLTDGKKGESPFAEGSYAEVSDVKRVGKPFTSAEVRAQVADTLGMEGSPTLRQLTDRGQRVAQQTIQDVRAEYQKYRTAEEAKMLSNETKEAAMEGRLGALDGVAKRWMELANTVHVGGGYEFTMQDGSSLFGVVTEITRKKGVKMPTALGAWVAKIALADGSRQTQISFSKMALESHGEATGKIKVAPASRNPRTGAPLEQMFDDGQSVSREQRVIVTGNLLAGYSTWKSGQIIHFTDNQGNVRQGILMPRSFKLEEAIENAPVKIPPAKAVQFLTAADRGLLKSTDGAVQIQRWGRGEFAMTVAKSKAEGGKYFLDPDLRRLTGDFVSQGSGMRAMLNEDQLRPALELIERKFDQKFETTSHRAEALAAGGEALGVKTGSDRLARGTGGGGMDRSDVERRAQAILDGFAVKPKGLVVVQSPQGLLRTDLGPNMRSAVEGGGNPIAAYYPGTGKIYIVADAIKSPEHLAGIMAHEMVVHFGLRSMLGSPYSTEYRQLLRNIATALPAATDYHGRREIPNYDPNRKSHKQIGAEEALAYYEQAQAQGGTIPPAWKQWVDKVHQIVRDWLRKIAGLPEKFDDLYVRNVLNALRQHLRTGRDRSTAEGEASNAMPKDTFYSSVERAVDAAKRDKGTGAEWEATLRNMPGVKQEEMEWLGLKDWLQGRGRVSKQEVADYVRAHRIEVGEHVLGMGGTGGTEHLDALRDWMDENEDMDEVAQYNEENDTDYHADTEKLIQRAAEGDADAIGQLEASGVPEQLLAPFYDLSNTVPPMRAEDIETLNQRVIDKFGEGLFEDQLEVARRGGAALADMLDSIGNRMGVDLTGIRLPTQEQIDGAPKYGEYTAPGGKNYREMLLTLPNSGELPPGYSVFRKGDYWHVRLPSGETIGEFHTRNAAVRSQGGNTDAAYRSNHFDQPNILVHARFDERQLPTGERTLHIAEIQSDWHHEGWQHGYKPARSPIVAAKAEWVGKPEDEGKRRGYWVVSDANGNFIRNAMDEPYATPTSRPLARTAQEAIDQTNTFLSENTGYDPNSLTSDQKVPDAPFKTTWQELALKRLLRYAVDKGFDALSWDTGQTVADRFSLRKQIDSLAYNGREFVAFGKNGQEVHRETGMGREGIERLVGKEIAQRLMDATPENGVRTLDGVGLDIGAEGKKAIYDKMLPTKMNKLVGKWGGKVERGEFVNGRTYVDMPTGKTVRGETVPAHIVKITPEMRNSVLEGMPLFARPMFARDGDPPPPYEEPRTPSKVYMAARRAATMMVDNRLVMDIRRLLNPKDVSAVSKEVAARTIPYLGELAHMKAQAQEHLEQFARAIGKLSPQDQLDMIHAIETGQRQPIAALQPAADAMRQMLDFWRDQVRALGDGYLENYLENYFPHFWQDKASDVEKMFASIQGRRTMRGPATFLKQRVVPTIRDGIEWGLKPATINPLVMTLLKVHEMQRFISGVTMMRSYKEHGLAVFQRAGKPTPAGWVKIDDPIARVSQWSEEEQGFIERGHYIMPEDGGRIINNHLSASRLRNFAPAQAFKFATNLLNSMQLGLSAFHLGFTTLDAMVSKNALAIEHMMHFEPLRAASAFLEAATPAGAIMNVRRGYQLMQAYLNPSGATPELRMLVNGLIAGGGRVKMDTYFLPTHGQSPFRGYGPSAIRADVRAALAQPHDKVSALTKAIGNIPVEYAQKMWNELHVLWKMYPKLVLPFEILGRITRATTAPIMEYIVPYQKLGVFSDLASNWMRRNPGADAEDVAKAMQAIWRSVDNRLGEMVYDNKFWDRTFKDTLHLGIRAVGWNFGTIEEIGGAPVDIAKALDKGLREGKINADDFGHKAPYVFGLMFTTALMGSIATYLMTGKGPDELKDYIFPKTGRLLPDGSAERISLPSYAKDIWEYAHHPGTTLIHKANPIFGEISDQWNGTDYFGHPIYNPSDKSTVFDWHAEDRAKHFFGEALPFSIQGQKQLQGAKEPGFTGEAFSAMPFVGLAPAPGVVTNPEKIESFQHYKELQAWKDKLKFDLKQAQKAGDKAKVQDIQRQLQESRRENAQEHSEYMRRKMEAQKRIQEQKRSGNTSDLIRTIGPIIDQSSSRAEMAQRIEKAGYPALAGLIGSLPTEIRPQVRAKLAEYA